MKKNSFLKAFLPILPFAGLIDAFLLTLSHYNYIFLPCHIGLFSDCGKVLNSSYSIVFGIPLALIGVIHYIVTSIVCLLIIFTNKKTYIRVGILLSYISIISSMYFVFLQAIVLHAYCQYCLISALICLTFFIFMQFLYKYDTKWMITKTISIVYKNFIKPFFFQIDPETIHAAMTKTGNLLPKIPGISYITSSIFQINDKRLSQHIHGNTYLNPIGLAAGFDYEADLTQILPSLGFGFQTVGTITKLPYEGNPTPRLGRLPQSLSLMVNKGYKNLGSKKTIEKLKAQIFSGVVGISIGRTNSQKLVTQTESVHDIIDAFESFEQSSLNHAYYELNISCPNLYGNITFYTPNNLKQLLTSVSKIGITRPIYIKMPISETNKDTLAMLEIISKYPIHGVIIGNLQKNRSHPSLIPNEVIQFSLGNFSGKPTFERSNELISLCYKHFSKRFIIIGCGGIFSAQDAYEKIKRGASLVQLITGMIYEGPQLVSQINLELLELLERDRLTHISQAIGTKST